MEGVIVDSETIKTMVAETIEEVTEEYEWDTSPEMYSRYADKLLEKFLIIDRGELPAIENHHEEDVVECNNETFYCDPQSGRQTSGNHRKTALMHLAVAEHFGNLASIKEINDRREELAQQFSGMRYAECPSSTRAGIDYIIETEKGQGRFNCGFSI